MEQSNETSIRPPHVKSGLFQRLRGVFLKSGQKAKRAVKKLKPKTRPTPIRFKLTKSQLKQIARRRSPPYIYVPRLRPETLDSPFANMPAELHLEVGTWLGNKDILNVARTCRKLNAIYVGKVVYLRMAQSLLRMDEPPVKGPNQLDGRPKFESFKVKLFEPDNFQKLCRFSNFLYRQCHTGATTKLFLVLLLQHLVTYSISRDWLPTIKRISQALGASINDHPAECSQIQGLLLKKSKLAILDYLVSNGLLLTSNPSFALSLQKPLPYCARYNLLDAVIYLLKHGFDPSEKDADGMSPIFKALGLYPAPLDTPAQHEGLVFYVDTKIKIVKLLIAAGADPNCIDAPESPVTRLFLHYGDAAKSVEYLAVLIPAFIKLGPPGGRYPAYRMCTRSSLSHDLPSASKSRSQIYTGPYECDGTEYLDTEINVEVASLYADKSTNNPLDFLVSPPYQDRIFPYVQRISLLSTFLAAGLPPDTRNDRNLTPLQLGIFRLAAGGYQYGQEDATLGVKEEKRFLLAAVKLLVKYGADVEEYVVSMGGYNVVEVAAALGEREFVEALVGAEEAERVCDTDTWYGDERGWDEAQLRKLGWKAIVRNDVRELVKKAKGFRKWEL